MCTPASAKSAPSLSKLVGAKIKPTHITAPAPYPAATNPRLPTLSASAPTGYARICDRCKHDVVHRIERNRQRRRTRDAVLRCKHLTRSQDQQRRREITDAVSENPDQQSAERLRQLLQASRKTDCPARTNRFPRWHKPKETRRRCQSRQNRPTQRCAYPGQRNQRNRRQRPRHGPDRIHRAFKSKRPPKLRRRDCIRKQSIPRRTLRAAPCPPHSAQNQDHRPGLCKRVCERRQPYDDVSAACNWLTPFRPVRYPPARKLRETGEPIRNAFDNSKSDCRSAYERKQCWQKRRRCFVTPVRKKIRQTYSENSTREPALVGGAGPVVRSLHGAILT